MNLFFLSRYLCLDEADRMLDMGFEPQIRRIVEQVLIMTFVLGCPEQCCSSLKQERITFEPFYLYIKVGPRQVRVEIWRGFRGELPLFSYECRKRLKLTNKSRVIYFWLRKIGMVFRITCRALRTGRPSCSRQPSPRRSRCWPGTS